MKLAINAVRLAAVVLLGAVPVNAEPANGGVDEGAVANVLRSYLREGMARAQYLESLSSAANLYDRTGNGLDRTDALAAEQVAGAQARSSEFSDVYRFDLDGDGQVQRGEILRSGGKGALITVADRLLNKFDADRDGTIAPVEIARGSRAPDSAEAQAIRLLLQLDRRRQHVSDADLRSAGDRFFTTVDRNGDDRISGDEIEALTPAATTQPPGPNARVASDCSPPRPAREAQLVFVQTYEAESLSSIAVGGQDKETNLANVVISPGRGLLHVVLTSYESMVWRFSGATERVSGVVVGGFTTAAGDVVASGVTGVPATRVHVLRGGCLSFQNNGPRVTALMGRAPDRKIETYSFDTVQLPDGALTKLDRRLGDGPTPPHFDAAMWHEALRFWPGGVVRVAPDAVVARTRVERYDVLPSQAGLAQLLGAGSLKRDGDGNLRIVAPIVRLPAQMNGSHSARLSLAPGVPMPPGDLGASCLVDEATGRKTGSICGTY